jgi:hypothetical protein
MGAVISAQINTPPSKQSSADKALLATCAQDQNSFIANIARNKIAEGATPEGAAASAAAVNQLVNGDGSNTSASISGNSDVASSDPFDAAGVPDPADGNAPSGESGAAGPVGGMEGP